MSSWKNEQLNHIKKQPPKKAYRELVLNFALLYVFNENSLCYMGFDIAKISKDKPVAEVILKDGEVAQIRHLREKPYKRKTSDFTFTFSRYSSKICDRIYYW